MTTTDRRTAPQKTKLKPENRRHPELRLAAEIAGVTYWMAYKVMRGQAQSAKVLQALKEARKQIAARKRKAVKEAQRQIREAQKRLRAMGEAA